MSPQASRPPLGVLRSLPRPHIPARKRRLVRGRWQTGEDERQSADERPGSARLTGASPSLRAWLIRMVDGMLDHRRFSASARRVLTGCRLHQSLRVRRISSRRTQLSLWFLQPRVRAPILIQASRSAMAAAGSLPLGHFQAVVFIFNAVSSRLFSGLSGSIAGLVSPP